MIISNEFSNICRRLAAKGKSLADFGFDQEVIDRFSSSSSSYNHNTKAKTFLKDVHHRHHLKTKILQVSAIKAFLSMQHPAHTPAINPSTLDIQVSPCLSVSPTQAL